MLYILRILFVCLIGFFRPSREFVTHCETWKGKIAIRNQSFTDFLCYILKCKMEQWIFCDNIRTNPFLFPSSEFWIFVIYSQRRIFWVSFNTSIPIQKYSVNHIQIKIIILHITVYIAFTYNTLHNVYSYPANRE